MNVAKRAMSATTSGAPPDPGYDEAPAPGPIDPATGQHSHYWVLSEEERAKGFVRPVRSRYRHVGPAGPKYPLRDLDAEKKELFDDCGYVKFEAYHESESPVTGSYWTQARLDNVGKGCQASTTMGGALAETYARQPDYYGSTFCVHCKDHFPVSEFVWVENGLVTTDRVGS